MERELRRQGGPSQQPLHRPDGQQPGDVAACQRSGGRADLRDYLRRAPRHHDAAGARIIGLDPRRLHGRDHGLGDHRGGDRRGRRRAARPDGDAAVLRLQHGRLLRALARDAQGNQPPAQSLHGQLVPQRAPTANSCGRVTAKICACSGGYSIGFTAAFVRIETPAGGVPNQADLDLPGSTSRPKRSAQALAVDPKEWKAEMESAGECSTR